MRHFYLCIPQCEQALVVDVELTEAGGRAEREAALEMLEMLEMLERSVCGPETMGATGAAPSTVAQPGIPATATASAGASGSKRSSAGSRRSAEAANCAISDGPATSSGSS